MNGADIACDSLLAHGIDTWFANPGTSEMHLVAALDRRPGIRCVLGLSEGVVTGAADGYARMADKPAATLLHCGPGLANGLANLHNARRARSPMVNIVGDHASYHLPYDAPLTSDIESLARPMSQWVGRVAGVEDVAPAIGRAYSASMSLPGVATLVMPADAAWNEAPAGIAVGPLAALPARPKVGREELRAAATALRSGKRVLLLLGGRALRAAPLAMAAAICARTGARMTAPVGSARIERGVGRAPIGGVPYPVDNALAALADIEVMVCIGATEPVAFFAYPGKPSRLRSDGCAVIDLAAPGDDLEEAVAALAAEVGAVAGDHDRPLKLPDLPVAGKLTGGAVAAIAARMMPEQAIVCNESVTQAWEFGGFTRDGPAHDWLSLTGGAIGIGIPLATGAAVACPERRVLSMQADGSGMYTCQGLWTQAREQLDVITIILANRSYAILHGEMRNVGVGQIGENARRMLDLDRPALDWVSLAKGMGVEAAAADTSERFADLLAGALRRRGPFLIEAMI